MAAFGVIALAALVWLILSVFATVRVFRPDKRFTMWYVKLWGGVPCTVFWLLPQVATAVVGAEAAAAIGMIGTTTWIGGLCYALLSARYDLLGVPD